MPTDRELQAAHLLAQPLLDQSSPSAAALVQLSDLRQALRIARSASLMLPEPRHVRALDVSREFWKSKCLELADLLKNATACLDDDTHPALGLPPALPAAERILAELRERAAKEEQQ